MTNLQRMRELLGKASIRPWSTRNENALNTWLIYPPYERLLYIKDTVVGHSEPKNYPLEDTEGNTKAITELMNKADDLLDLWEACQEYKTHLPNMEPVGAAKFSSQLKAAMRIREVLKKLEGAE